MFEVYVGNIGRVYRGSNEYTANETFEAYVELSTSRRVWH